MDLKHKNLPVFGVKTLSDQGDGVVEAFVSGIGNKDSAGDIVVSGAYDDSLTKRTPKGVWAHNWDLPVSKTLEIYEVPAGDQRLPKKILDAGIGALYVKTQFNLKTQRGQDAYADVQFFGDEGEWSIGYAEVETTFSKDLQANMLLKIDLYEYSFVLFGANSLTATGAMKALVADITDAAKSQSLTPEQSKAFALSLKELSEVAENLLPADQPDTSAVEEAAPDGVGVGGAPNAPKEVSTDALEAEKEKGFGAEPPAGSLEAQLAEVRDAVQATLASDGHYAWPVATFGNQVVVEHTVTDGNGGSSETYHEQHAFVTNPDGSVTVETAGVPVDLVQVVVGKGLGESLTAAVKTLETADGGVPDVKDLLSQKAGSFVLSKANHERVTAAHSALDGVLADYQTRHGVEDAPVTVEIAKTEEAAVEVTKSAVEADPEPAPAEEAMVTFDEAALAEFKALTLSV